MLRRTIAIFVLLTMVGGSLEIGFGLAREGAVHHESEVQALLHSSAQAGPIGNHGHEDRAFRSVSHQAEQKGHHEHGTEMDHCTHLHAPALPGHASAPIPTLCTVEVPIPTLDSSHDGIAAALFHPPRAA